MRAISSNGLAKLTTQYGIEPIMVVEIDWTDGSTATYAGRDIPATADSPFIPGKIVAVGILDDVVDMVLQNGTSAQVELTLDDTDGTIKALFNQYDFHLQPVRVYQWFAGLDLSDMFLVFAGKINTPVSWDERDRTVKLTVLSHLEDVEVGFQPDEGEFTWLPSEMCGKAWPMGFGTVVNMPAVRVTRICEAVTITPVGIPSGSDAALAAPLYANGTNTDQKTLKSLFKTSIQMNTLMQAADCWLMAPGGGPGSDAWNKSQQLLDQWNALEAQMIATRKKLASKEECITLSRHDAIDYMATNGVGPNPIQTLGGEDFPQNTPIWINIGGGSFYGYFSGNLFYCSQRVNLDDAVQLNTDLYTFQEGQCPNTKTGGVSISQFNFTQSVPIGGVCDGQDEGFFQGGAITPPPKKDLMPGQMRAYGSVAESSGKSGMNFPGIGFGQLPPASSWLRIFWKEGGQSVHLETAEPVSYIVSIVPGTVLSVSAFKQYDGPHNLTVVPTSYYSVSTVNYGPITAVVLTLSRQLSTYKYPDDTNQGWSDELYVSFQSTVGPNTVDIMKYLIDTYSDLTWDADSFNYVAGKLAAYPSNCAILDTKNLIDVLRDIAWQARCAIWLEDDVFYLRYLPEEPLTTNPNNPIVDTILVSDTDSETGVNVSYTSTEQIVTKMKVNWRLDLAPDNPYPSDADKHEQQFTLRHNMAAYGLHEKTYNFWIYNQPDIIFKCATFWLIRYSTTWKTLKFSTTLNKLNIETLDAITFDDGGRQYATTGPITVVVKKAAYDSSKQQIDFECECPVKAGELVYYPFYWPSNLAANVTWPPADEIASGNAGGGGIGVEASGNLPIGVVNGQLTGQTVFIGGPNIAFGANSDWGDKSPGDTGFTAQPTFPSNSITTLPDSVRPYIPTGMSFLNEEPAIPGVVEEDVVIIDLYKTQIMDSSTIKTNPTQVGALGDFFSINPAGGLRCELSVAQVQSTSVNGQGNALVTSGADAGFADMFGIVPLPQGVTPGPSRQNQNKMLALNSANAGVYCTTTDMPAGAKVDFKYDATGQKVGIATAFLQAGGGLPGP